MATAQVIAFPTSPESVLERFETYLLARRGLAQSTVVLLTGFIRRAIPEIGTNPTHDQVEIYIARKRRAGTSYANLVNAIKSLEYFMLFLGNPIRLGRPRKPEPIPPEPLSEAEVAILLSHARTLRQRCIIALLAYTGLRNRELRALRIRDIDIPNQLVHVENGKGSKSRIVCIAGAACKLLLAYMRERAGNPDDLLFLTVRRKTKLADQDLRKIVRETARDAGLGKRVWPHLMRHTLASNMLHRGANLLSIKEQLGHAYLATTMIYLHASKDRLSAEYRMFCPSYL
jgi:integrase/recombinase XerD